MLPLKSRKRSLFLPLSGNGIEKKNVLAWLNCDAQAGCSVCIGFERFIFGYPFRMSRSEMGIRITQKSGVRDIIPVIRKSGVLKLALASYPKIFGRSNVSNESI